MSAMSRMPVASVVDERLRTTSICLGVAYGARHDPENLGGLAHMLEHLLMAAPVDGKGPLVEYIERLGGNANAETGLEHMLFHAQVDAADADEGTPCGYALCLHLLSSAGRPGTTDSLAWTPNSTTTSHDYGGRTLHDQGVVRCLTNRQHPFSYTSSGLASHHVNGGTVPGNRARPVPPSGTFRRIGGNQPTCTVKARLRQFQEPDPVQGLQ